MASELYNRPQPKREPELPEQESETKDEGTDWERTRYVGRSDPAQATHWRVSIEEPLNIPIRCYKIWDPPIIPEGDFPDRHLKLNIASVEQARLLYAALGNALEAYEEGESGE